MKLSKVLESGAQGVAVLGIALSLFSFATAKADAFTDRARGSYQRQEDDREAQQKASSDKLIIRFIKKVNAVEKRNGGLNNSMKCYYGDYIINNCNSPVAWSAGGYSTTIYMRDPPWVQKYKMGFSKVSVDTCHFETNNGFACSVGYPWDDPYVKCFNAKHVQFEEQDGRLVKYVPGPQDNGYEEPVSTCASAKLDQLQAEQTCGRIAHSRQRQTCMDAIPALPTNCQ